MASAAARIEEEVRCEFFEVLVRSVLMEERDR